MTFTWPLDPEDDNRPMDPFAAMGMGINTSLAWTVAMDGRVVQLLFNENQGPQELVCRHPSNWGWVLYSQATCWVRIRILAAAEAASAVCSAGMQCPSHCHLN